VTLSLILHHLAQPEYVHVLLNPVPVYGMAAAVFVLAAAMATRSRSSQAIGLALVIGVVLVSWAAFHYGGRGYDRVFAMSNDDAQKWLNLHAERATTMMWVFAAAGVGAVAALTALIRRSAWSFRLVGVVLLLSVVGVVLAGWVSQAGGQVRHSEFRTGPPA
jgi:hypothetical protein